MSVRAIQRPVPGLVVTSSSDGMNVAAARQVDQVCRSIVINVNYPLQSNGGSAGRPIAALPTSRNDPLTNGFLSDASLTALLRQCHNQASSANAEQLFDSLDSNLDSMDRLLHTEEELLKVELNSRQPLAVNELGAMSQEQLEKWMTKGYVDDHELSALLNECDSRAITANKMLLFSADVRLDQIDRNLVALDESLRNEEQELQKIKKDQEVAEVMSVCLAKASSRAEAEAQERAKQAAADRDAAAASGKKVDDLQKGINRWERAQQVADFISNNWGKLAIGTAAAATACFLLKKAFSKIFGDQT